MHIREVTVEIQWEQEKKALVRKKSKMNRFPDILGTNLTYLLRLGQVADHTSLSSIWKTLAD